MKESQVLIQKYHIVFLRGFNNDTVTFDILKFEVTEELIAEATCITREGYMWFKKIPFIFNPKYFLLP